MASSVPKGDEISIDRVMKLFYKVLLLMIAGLVGSQMVVADSRVDNSAYETGNYSGAVAAYEKWLASHGANSSVLFNLGNSYYQLGDYGRSIYAYERARVLSPRDRSVKQNLRLALKAAQVDHSERRISAGVFGVVKFNTLAVSVVGCLLMVLLTIGIGKFLAGWVYGALVVRGLFLISIFVLLVSVVALIVRKPELNRAIVVSSTAKVRLSPFATAEELKSLKAGQSVVIEGVNGSFYRVKDGWVSSEDAQPIYQGRRFE